MCARVFAHPHALCARLADDEPPLPPLPVLPCDVLRVIWQACWRDEAASMLQSAWRAYIIRRACISCLRYVMRYAAKGDSGQRQDAEWVPHAHYIVSVEYQSRGQMHMHAVVRGAIGAYDMEEVD